MALLHLHIGQWKTGTSWIQASLRLSRAALAQAGIDYPPRRERPGLGASEITSGNGRGLLRGEAALAEALAAHAPAPGRHLLFSSELLQKEMREAGDLAFIPRAARAAGLDGARVMLFVRDPVGHAASFVQQRVKRHGDTDDVEALFGRFDAPVQALELVERIEAAEGLELRLRNYSACRDSLLAEMADWLGVPEETLARPPAARINRSLTAGEFELQRALNAAMGADAQFLADAVCERLPELQADLMLPAPEVQEAMLERVAPAMAQVDRRLPEAHRYRRDLRPPGAAREAFSFTSEQIALIAEEMVRPRLALRAIRRDPAAHFGARALLRAALRRAARRLRRGG
jgi:hypothetical protein